VVKKGLDQVENNTFVEKVDGVLNKVRQTLILKNREYGNAALEPLCVFSTLPAEERIKARLDEKLSRLAKGKGNQEDTILDLLGCLVLLKLSTDGDNTFYDSHQ
jgi:hypothetical protein